MAGQDSNIWLNRAVADAQHFITVPHVAAFVAKANTSNDEWYGELKAICQARRKNEGVFLALSYFILNKHWPDKLAITSPIVIWSPGRKFYGTDFKRSNPQFYHISPVGGPTIRDDRVYLELHPEVTRSDLDFFLTTHWQRDVVPLLESLAPKRRLRRSELAIRDDEIRAKRDAGASYTTLVKEYGISKRRIEQITKEKS